MSTPALQVLKRNQTELELLLKDINLLKLSRDLLRNTVLSEDVSDKFASLDPDHLEPEVKVRYLLNKVYERVSEDDSVCDRLVSVLSRLGGEVKALCRAIVSEVNYSIRREINKLEKCTASGGEVEDIELVEQDVSGLVEVLVSGSHLWDVIGIALGLPKHKRVDCSKGEEESVSKLSNILTTWILGSYEGARPATLSSLREALASKTVGLGKLALELMAYERSVDPLPVKKPRVENKLIYQSCNTEVAEGKSTLLEVQVSSSGGETYQWNKDGEPLLDGADYSGVCSNMLYINRASQCTEGKYSCCVSLGIETIRSNEMSLKVVYPIEKGKLLDFYSLTETEVPLDSWPPVVNTTFINLVLIRQKPMSTCDYYTIRGDMDDILESKEVAEYKDIFKEYREGDLVLVEGRPGSGKTTLVHKLTRDWAVGKKVLRGAKIVFLITLRLLNASERDKSLLDLLKIFYGEDLGRSVEHDLQKCRGKGACFILDGLDEYPIKSKKQLIINELINIKTILPHSMVIVASRPVATCELRKTCKARIEVVGFSKEQIYSYVQSYPFSDCSASMACKVKEFLDQHPNVRHMCYLPIHAAMICFLFSELKDNIPHTETKIYEQFTIATLLKHKERCGEELQLRSLKDLKGKEKELFSSVCKLAFDMIVNSQQVVSKSDLTVSQILDSDFGWLTVERTSKYYGNEEFYTFCHLTFQEFLAAFHIHEAQLLDLELNIENIALKNVWKYYSGLFEPAPIIELFNTGLTDDFLFKVQCAFESQQVELCDFVVSDSIRISGIISSMDFIALGYVISKSSKVVKKITLDYCHFNSEGITSFVSLATSNKLQFIRYLKVSFGECTNDNINALNLLLVHLPCLEELDLFGIRLDKSIIESLTCGITLPHLRVLKINIKLVPCSYMEMFLKRLQFGSCNKVQVYYRVDKYHTKNYVLLRKILSHALCYQTIQSEYISWIQLCNSDYFSFPHERLSYCTDVVLVNCHLCDEGAQMLANTLNPQALENLVLDFNRISDSGAVTLAGCLARCSVVQEVSIQCNSIGDSGATALADALVHCSSLRKLDLQGNSLGDKGALTIVKATKGLPGLDLYLHNVNITEEGIEIVIEHRASTEIRKMVFTSSWDSVSESDVDTLGSALYCGYLPALKLSPTNIAKCEKLVKLKQLRNVRGITCLEITDDVVPLLCSIIQKLTSLHSIDFNVTEISSASAQLLSDSLKSCKSIHNVKFRDCIEHPCLLDAIGGMSELRSLHLFGLQSDDVALFFSNYQIWVNLHSLILSECDIDSYNAKVLIQNFRHCKCLHNLEMGTSELDYIGVDGIDLSEGLKDHTGLSRLCLHGCWISSEVFTSVISRNHLQHLELNYYYLDTEYMAALVDVICGDTLHTLSLVRNYLSTDDIARLSFGLQKCTQLQTLDISHNDLGSHELAYLAEGLKHCCNLRSLRCGLNSITSSDVPAILSIMNSCKYLQYLDLSLNKIGVDGASDLIYGWQRNSVLTLELGYCFDDPHKTALEKVEKCCNSCDRMLDLYYNNDYVIIELLYGSVLPKLISSEI